MEEESSRPGAEEAAAIRAVMDKIVRGLTASGRDAGPAAMARRFGCSAVTIKKRKAGERRLPRAFVDAAAQAAGLRRAELYLDLGWLAAEEVLREEPGSMYSPLQYSPCEGSTTPYSRPEIAIAGFTVEPGGYWPCSARLNSGRCLSSLSAL